MKAAEELCSDVEPLVLDDVHVEQDWVGQPKVRGVFDGERGGVGERETCC